MGGDKPAESKDKSANPSKASGIESHGHIRPEDQANVLQHVQNKDATEHDQLLNSRVLPHVEIDEKKKQEKGFFGNLVDGVSNAIANADKQANAMVEGAKHGIDDAMKKVGVPEDVRKNVNQSINQVTEIAKDPEKAAGQILDATEAAIDQGMKNVGVSDDVRKNVDGAIHAIRRIDEAELKFVKGIGKGTQKLVGDLTHGAAELTAETLDKAEEYKKTSGLIDVAGVGALGVATVETLGKAAVNALGAAEKFGEQLKEDSDKVGGLDKLAAKKVEEAGKWVAETNLENAGQKAEQIGEVVPDVAALAAGGAGLFKAAGKVAESLNAIRKGSQLAEAATATEVVTTAEAVSDASSAEKVAAQLKSKISVDGKQYSLYEDGSAVVESANGELQRMNYVMPWSDSETAIMYAENATGKQMLNDCLVLQLDEGTVSQGMLKGGMYGSEMVKDMATFEQALSELPSGSKLVGAGHQRIAFSTPDGDVIVLGPVTERPPCPLLSQPLEKKPYSPKVQAEKYEKLETAKVQDEHIKQVEKDMHDAGWEYDSDPNAGPANFGLDKNGNAYLIDPEDVIGRRPLIEINPDLADPVYRKYISLAEAMHGGGSSFVCQLWQDLADLHKAHQQFEQAAECLSHIAQ